MATYSSILAWRIPQTEKPGRLQSMESQESGTTKFKGNCSHTAPSHGKEQSCNWANFCKANHNSEPQGLLITKQEILQNFGVQQSLWTWNETHLSFHRLGNWGGKRDAHGKKERGRVKVFASQDTYTSKDMIWLNDFSQFFSTVNCLGILEQHIRV